MSVLSSELRCGHFLTKSRNLNTGHGGGTIFNTDISLGEILNKTENEREKKSCPCPSRAYLAGGALLGE